MPQKYSEELAFVEGQLEEVEKLALRFPTNAIRRAGGALYSAVSSRMPVLSPMARGQAIGTAVGAIGGGAAGAATAPEGSRLSGVLSGATTGGLLGLGIGHHATQAGREWTKNLGKRQLHGLTGWMPGDGFGRGLTPAQRVAKLEEMGFRFPTETIEQAREAVSKGWTTGRMPQAIQERLAKMRVNQVASHRELAEMGATSAPGYLGALARSPVRTLRAGVRQAGPLGLGLAVPFAAMPAGEAIKERDPAKFTGALAEGAAYTLAPLPIVGATALGSLARRVGEAPWNIRRARPEPVPQG